MKNFYLYLTVLIGLISFPAYGETESSAQNEDPFNQYEGKNGDFSAMLIPIFEEDLVEFDRPPEDGPRLTIVNTASCGDRIAVKIVFTGMSLTEDNFADVTFDFLITQPDGSPYSGSQYDGLTAVKGNIINPTSVYNNEAIPGMTVEDTDPIGSYVISATVKDNIGDKHIVLYKRLEVLKCETD